MNSVIFAGKSDSPPYGTHFSKEGIFCKVKNTTKCMIIRRHPQHIVELCGFIVDDSIDGIKKKEKKKIDGEKNKFKCLGIIKTGTMFAARGRISLSVLSSGLEHRAFL